jgi:hypothetical protein
MQKMPDCLDAFISASAISYHVAVFAVGSAVRFFIVAGFSIPATTHNNYH